MYDLKIVQYTLEALVFIISLTIHEYSHGLMSYIQGDPTAKNYGRLTFNPFAHIDLFGIVSLFIVHFGWAKPVPIDPRYYKNERRGIIFTSLAGPVSNLLLALLSVVAFVIFLPDDYNVKFFLSQMIMVNISLAVFNFIPVPPLDGSKIFAELFQGRIKEFIYRIDMKGMFLVFFILWIPIVNEFYSNIVNGIVRSMVKFALLVFGR